MASLPSPHMVLGPYYFGVVLNTFLYGTVIYYQGYKSDKPWLRFFVLYLFIVETLNTGICVATIYEPLVGQFVLPAREDVQVMQSENLEPFLEIAISAPVQVFYSWRIYKLLGSAVASTFICIATLGSLVGALWTVIILHQAYTYLDRSIVDRPALIWAICAAVADLTVTASLVISLARRKTGIKPTDDMINRIVRRTLHTGLTSGAFAVLDIVLFVALPDSTLSFVFDFMLPKIYSNALISTLNARDRGTVKAAIGQKQSNVLLSESTRESATVGSIIFNKPNARMEFIEMNSDMLDLGTEPKSFTEPE
ncbi:hypothetical protein B0H13DRAFT_1884081 [Mycena leptocephala]|nr:hypothetical protein B0H13DRAFT_1884081 [Mycena leptocephala]